MSDKPAGMQPPERLSLRRWSQRKREGQRSPEAKPEPATSAAPSKTPPPPPVASTGRPGAAPPVEPSVAPPALPPIESLTIDSDYAPFFQPHVDATTRRAALKQLFRDPRFNIMDGLDSLVGDFSKADPIPPEMLKQLAHARHIFDPPRTMVNAEGHVVDVVEAESQPPLVTAAATAPAAAAPGSAERAPAVAPQASGDESAKVDDATTEDAKP